MIGQQNYQCCLLSITVATSKVAFDTFDVFVEGLTRSEPLVAISVEIW